VQFNLEPEGGQRKMSLRLKAPKGALGGVLTDDVTFLTV